MIFATLDPKASILRRWHAKRGARAVKDAEIDYSAERKEGEEFVGDMVLGFRADPTPYMPGGWRGYDPPVAGKGVA